MTATLGPEDGLNIAKKKGTNKLETEIKGDKKHKKKSEKKRGQKKDKDSVKFYVLDQPAPTCTELAALQLPEVTILAAEEISAGDGQPAHPPSIGPKSEWPWHMDSS